MNNNSFGMSMESLYIDSSQYRLAYLYASPLIDSTGAELPLLDTQQEIAILRECLRDAKRSIYFKVDVATPQNLRTIATLGAVMIHYSGHGFPGILAFENGRGEVHRLDAESLKTLFAAGGVQTKIVFVSACHSEAAGRKFVEAGVPHVIALNNRVSDSSSRIFAQNLYFSLFRGKKTVREAFEIASNMVMVSEGAKPTDQKKFLLLPEDSPHDVIIFENAPKGRYIDETEPLAPNNCDKPPKYFVGRKKLMQQVFFCLGVSNNRCVTIRGERGIGKTALASRCCEYMNERKIFDVIYFVPLRRRGANPYDDHNVLAAFLAACMGSAGDEVHSVEELIQVLLGHRGNLLAKGNSDRGINLIRREGSNNSSNGNNGNGNNKLNDTNNSAFCQSNRYEPERKYEKILFVIDGADDFVVDPSIISPINQSLISPSSVGNDISNISNDHDRVNVSIDSMDECNDSHNLVVASPVNYSNDLSRRQGLITLLGEILRRTENVKFLITSCNRLAGGQLVWQLNEPEKVISVERLTNRQSAELLVKMAPRGLKPSEMNSDNPAIALDTLSARPVLKELGGHPRAIAMFASFLTDKLLDDTEEMCNIAKDVLKRAQEWREEFDPDSIPCTSAPTNSISKDEFRTPPGVPILPIAVAVATSQPNFRRDQSAPITVSANIISGNNNNNINNNNNHSNSNSNSSNNLTNITTPITSTRVVRAVTETTMNSVSNSHSRDREHDDHERRRSSSSLSTFGNGRSSASSSSSNPTPIIVHPTLRPSPSVNVLSYNSKDENNSKNGEIKRGMSGGGLSSRSQPFLRNVSNLTDLTSPAHSESGSNIGGFRNTSNNSLSNNSLSNINNNNSNTNNNNNNFGLEMEEARRVARAVIHDPICAEVWARVSAANTSNGNLYTPPLTSVRWTLLVVALSDSLEEETKVTLDHPTPQSGDDEDALSVTLSRKLVREDIKFIGHKIRLEEAPVIQGKSRHDGRAAIDYTIARSRYIVFCEEWWAPLLKTLQILKVEFSCREPMVIHGFLSRQKTEEKLLETGALGVFLLRFSESQKGHLVVSFTDRHDGRSRRDSLSVHHCLVAVNREGLSIFFESGECSYPTLEELIMNCSSLKLLYPDIPKEHAFDRVRAFRSK